ncbi:hypothetical protein FOCC_FOCC008952 [Frankliniella occidentalis]|nr:hypothetical protein FOCC_FOCC008952 [Frankliniella occidentalis]
MPSSLLLRSFGCRDCMARSNSELERYIAGLETELDRHEEEQAHRSQEAGRHLWWGRLDGQLVLCRQLEARRRWLEQEVTYARRMNGLTDPNLDPLTLDLDSLSEMELIIVVRQLERMREDLQAALRHKIWSPERDKASAYKTTRDPPCFIGRGGRTGTGSEEALEQASGSEAGNNHH